jgi:hypothetical protein
VLSPPHRLVATSRHNSSSGNITEINISGMRLQNCQIESLINRQIEFVIHSPTESFINRHIESLMSRQIESFIDDSQSDGSVSTSVCPSLPLNGDRRNWRAVLHEIAEILFLGDGSRFNSFA